MNKKILDLMKHKHIPISRKNNKKFNFSNNKTKNVFSIIQILFGIQCIFFTEYIYSIFAIISGVLMLCLGLCDIWYGFHTKEYKRAETKLTSQGIVLFVLGGITLLRYAEANFIVVALWGVVGLLKGSELLNTSICAAVEGKSYISTLLHGVIEIILAIALLLNPGSSLKTHIFILGIEFVVIGIQLLKEK